MRQPSRAVIIVVAFIILVPITLFGEHASFQVAAANATKYTASATITTGTGVGGSHSDTHSDNNVYHYIDSSGKTVEVDYTIEAFSGFSEDDLTQIYVYSKQKIESIVESSCYLYLYDFDGSSWVQQDSDTGSTSEFVMDDTETSNLGKWIDGSNNLKLRIEYNHNYIWERYLAVDYIYVDYTYEVNSAPVNDGCSFDNPDDTDNMYAQKRVYEFTVNTHDDDGYYDITTIEFEFLQEGGSGIWSITYTESTNSFAETDPSNYIEESSSTYSKSGSASGARGDIDLTIKLKIEWAHSDVTNYDIVLTTTDSEAASDEDTYDLNIDVETRLDCTDFAVSDGSGTATRGDVSSSLTFTGTVVYYAQTTSPPQSAFHNVHLHYDPEGDWLTSDTTIVNGEFSMSYTARSTVKAQSYEVHGNTWASGGGHMTFESDPSCTYITDRVEVTWGGHNDATPDGDTARQNEGSSLEVRFFVVYEYDTSDVESGTVTANGTALSYDNINHWWEGSVTLPSAASGYSVVYVVDYQGGDTHGITGFNSTSANEHAVGAIPDAIEATLTTDYGRIDILVNANIYVDLVRVYDGSAFDGTFSLNDTTYDHGTIGIYGYTIDSISGGTYGITTVDPNDEISIIFDELEVYWSNSDDSQNRTEIGDTVGIEVRLRSKYDQMNVTGGTATVKINGSIAYSGTGSVGFVAYFDKNTVGQWMFEVTMCAWSTAEIDMDAIDTQSIIDHRVYVIWDSVTVTLTQPTYWKVPNGVNASGLLVSGTYDYDGQSYDGTINLNDTNYAHSAAGYYGYQADSIAGDDAYGITAMTSSNSIQILWQTVNVTWSHFWTRYSDSLLFVHIDLTDLAWSVEGTQVPNGVTINLYENTSLFWSSTTSSGTLSNVVEDYGLSWEYVTWTVKINYVVSSYNFTLFLFKTESDTVPVVHTCYKTVWDYEYTDLYLYVTWGTNWRNASLTIWWNTSNLLDHFTEEGTSQITLPTSAGLYMFDFLVNGTGTSYTNDGTYPTSDSWFWMHMNYTVSLTSTTIHFYFYRAKDGSYVDWQEFKLWVDETRLNEPKYTTTASTVNLTLTDFWNSTVYQDSTLTVTEFVDIGLDVHWLTLINQKSFSCNVSITFLGRTIWEDLGPYEAKPLRVYGGNYTVYWYRVDNGNEVDTTTDADIVVDGNKISQTSQDAVDEDSGGPGDDEEKREEERRAWIRMIILVAGFGLSGILIMLFVLVQRERSRPAKK